MKFDERKSSLQEFLQFIHQLEGKIHSLTNLYENLDELLNIIHQSEKNIQEDFRSIGEYISVQSFVSDPDEDEFRSFLH